MITCLVNNGALNLSHKREHDDGDDDHDDHDVEDDDDDGRLRFLPPLSVIFLEI